MFGFNFWSEWFWLKPNMTWKEFENPPNGERMASIYDFWIIIPIAVVMHISRLIIERHFWRPVGLYFGLKDSKPRPLTYIPVLETAFKKNRRPNSEELQNLAALSKKSVKGVSNWFRRKRNNEKSSFLNKFSESGWRFCFYFCASMGGIYVMYDKIWLWDTRHCWYNFPYHSLPDEIRWYFMLELGYYTSAAVSIFFDVKRKDFLEMFLHHLVAISLMMIAYSGNFFRIGSYVLVIHDVVDYWMEAAKMAKYIQYNRLCDTLFCIFALSWFVTRLYLYPFRVLHACLIEGPRIAGYMFPACYVINTLLVILQCLHFVWFILIMRIVLQVIRHGQVQKDSRSDSEISFSDTDDKILEDGSTANGVKKSA